VASSVFEMSSAQERTRDKCELGVTSSGTEGEILSIDVILISTRKFLSTLDAETGLHDFSLLKIMICFYVCAEVSVAGWYHAGGYEDTRATGGHGST
jgi:hypothetical protein